MSAELLEPTEPAEAIDSRPVVAIVVAHPAHDPVYEGFISTFSALQWRTLVILPHHAATVYAQWKQTPPEADALHTLTTPLSPEEAPTELARLYSRRVNLIIYDDYKGRPEIFAEMRSRCPVLLVAHNARRALEPYPGRGMERLEKNRPRRNGLRRLFGLLVLSQTIAQHTLEHLHPGRSIYWLPDSMHRQTVAFTENHRTDDNRFVVAIPGNLTRERKDFPPVMEALRQLRTENRRRMQFRFIGGIGDASGESVADELLELQKQGVPLTFWRRMLTDAEFEEQMRGVDVLLQPLPRVVEVDGFHEEYNRTKISGTVGHQIRRGLPVIQPRWIPQDDAFATSTLFYEQAQELHDHLDRLAHQPSELHALKEFALENARVFTPERIALHARETILSPLSLLEAASKVPDPLAPVAAP